MVTLPVLLLTAALSASSETVLLDFTAEWCAPCRMVAPEVQRLEDRGYPVRRINVDQHPELVRQYRIEAVPCFILLHEGREVARLTEAANFDRLVQMFDTVRYRPAVETREIVRGQSPDDTSSVDVPVDQYGANLPAAASANTYPANDYSAPGMANAAGPADSALQPAEQAALAASVRIKVLDEQGHSFGTGTIIDTHGEEALVITCGHLFRESAGKGQIFVELLGAGGREPIPAQLIEYHADARDIALLAIRPGTTITPVRVAASKEGQAPGAAVFSIGCDHGGEPRIARSQITAIDRYMNAPNIEVAGVPVLGRSGGGLFTADGRLIGICNAADEVDNEGIYAGLPSIHWQLDRIGLQRVYQPGAAEPETSLAAAEFPASPNQAMAEVPGAQPASAPRAEATPIGASPVDLAQAATMALNTTASARELIQALEDGSEVICVIRKPNQNEARAVVLDASARDLLTRLARDAKAVDLGPATIKAAETATRALGNISVPH